MSHPKKSIPPHLRRGLAVLILFLMGISISRLLVSMHRQQERIEILEGQVAQLMADTTRLAIAAPTPHTTRTDVIYPDPTTPRARRPRPADSPPSPPQAPSAHPVASTRKFTEPHLFDLNTIDSLTLIRIPGIAARTASTILQHRQRYGGFAHPQQLSEFLTWDAAQAYLDEWCTQWFTANPARIQRLAVNTASVADLQRHPYISHAQAVDLVRYRTRHQRISGPAELLQIPSFPAPTVDKLLPYLSFD